MGVMLPLRTNTEPTKNASAYMKKISDWEKANTIA